MSSPNKEPPPESPERISLLKFESAGFSDDGTVLITATFRYDTWCCSDSHEIVAGVNALSKAIEQSYESEQAARLARLEDEYRWMGSDD
jgi:hypothetical protein